MPEPSGVSVGAIAEILRRAAVPEARIEVLDRSVRIRVSAHNMAHLLQPDTRQTVTREIKALGAAYVALDLEPDGPGVPPAR